MNMGGAARKKTDPKALALVLAVIVLIAGAVFLRLWANQQRLDVPNFHAMTTAPDGRIFVVIGNDLYVEDGAGKSLQVMPLSRWGVRNHYGDLAVLEDGGVILAQGRLGDVGLAEGVRMYKRERPSAHDPAEGLQRCAFDTGECAALVDGSNGFDVRRAFSIDVDEAAGRMYMSDPANHRVIMTNMKGERLAVSDQGWIFPNGVIRVNATTVGFADTNRHRYVELAVDADGFGEIRREESILGWPDVDLFHRFPFEVLIDGGGALWMLVAGNNMADAWLYRRGSDGEVRRIALPEGADPVALTLSGERVLVADAQHFAIHALDLSGDVLQPFGSGVLRERLAEYQRVHSRYEAIFDYSLLAVLLIALPALVMGVILQRRAERAETAEVIEAAGGRETPLATETLRVQLAQLRGEFIFWRKHSALGTREAARLGVLVTVLILALATFVLLSPSPVENGGRALDETLHYSLRIYLIAVFGASALGFYWLSGMYERLHITSAGIRYTSFLSGPLRFLNGLHPDWFIRREDIREIRLVHRGDGRRQQHWFYEVVGINGGSWKVRPLVWRLAGEHETGIPLRSLTRLTSETFRTAIRQTVLYRLLARQRAGVAGPVMAVAMEGGKP